MSWGAPIALIGRTGTAGRACCRSKGLPPTVTRFCGPAPGHLGADHRCRVGAHGVVGAGHRRPTTAVTAPDGLAPLAVPTQSAPLRLLVIGDSLGIDFGQPLVNDLAATDVVSAVLDGHIDTGLARPDYFDWQTELQRDITSYQPQAVVVFIGANDPQNFVDGSDGALLRHPGLERRLRQARQRLHGGGHRLGGQGPVDRDAAHGRSHPQRQDGEPERHRPAARPPRTRA